MSVPEDERGKTKLSVITKANELAIYTIKICINPKVFLPEYQNALTNDIIKCAKDIFISAWRANDIHVRNGKGEIVESRLNQRTELQYNAIYECNNLLALMQIAQKLFHLKTKRIKYWGDKTKEVRTLITKWKDSDIKRYSN